MTTINHPRHGTVEVLAESNLFYQIEHPEHAYTFWFPKTELDVEPAAAKKQRKQKLTAEQKAARVLAARNRRQSKATRKALVEFIECVHGIKGGGTCELRKPALEDFKKLAAK